MLFKLLILQVCVTSTNCCSGRCTEGRDDDNEESNTSSAGGPGLISGRSTRLHMSQIKIARAVTKTQGRQIDNK